MARKEKGRGLRCEGFFFCTSRFSIPRRPPGTPGAAPLPARAAPGETAAKRGIWQARGGGSVFVNAGLLLYIMYFPVYNKEGDYNNFTSAHSWPVLTLGICDALFLYKRPGLGLCFLLSDFIFFFNLLT